VKFKIDDVAKACGLTKRTIRYYEEIGLLSPPERSEGGMRLYTELHIERLKQIVNARDVLGYTLQEIMDFVSVSEQLETHKAAYRQTEASEEKLQQLREMKEIVGRQLATAERKVAKMVEFREEIGQMQKRIDEAIAKLST